MECSTPLTAEASPASPVLSIAEGEENRRGKPTLGFVIMLTDVSVGAGISVRLDTVVTPSSSLSFYTQ
jgi:hypothetical protein